MHGFGSVKSVPTRSTSTRFPLVLLSLIALLVGGFPVLAASWRAASTDQIAVVWPAGWSRAEQMRATARADARIVRFGGAPGVMVVEAEAFPELRAAGALFFLDPQAVGACALGADRNGGVT
ncbi:MAG: hypothetical protein AAFX09_11630 [Pseudomonadota bacterium]